MFAIKFSKNLIKIYRLMKNRKVTKRLANMLYTLLCIVICACGKQKDIVVTHYCEGENGNWSRNIWVKETNHLFVRCDMCNTVIEIDNGKIIREDTKNKTKPKGWI